MRVVEQGFTVVEVLVTLLIASMLLMVAYQGYGLVVASGADSRNLSEASNIAYESMRRNIGSAPSACSVATSSETVTSTTLPSPRTLTVSRTCPYGVSNPISLITITLTYGSDGKVIHANYTRT